MNERIPPQAIESEQSVLGSMMIERGALLRGLELLEGRDFYRPTHSQIFRAFGQLTDDGEPVDLVTLQEQLRRNDALADVGGTEYLMACIDRVPTAANLEHYAAIVREKSRLRRLIGVCTEIVGAAYEEEEGIIDRASRRINDIAQDRGEDDLVFGPDLTEPYIQRIAERKGEKAGNLYSSGFPSIDAEFGQFGQAQKICLLGRRKECKTHFGVHCIAQCIKAGQIPLIYSLEMHRLQFLDRMLAHAANVDSKLLRRAELDDWSGVNEAINKLADCSWYLCDRRINVPRMQAHVRRLQSRGLHVGLVMIDYAELVKRAEREANFERVLSENVAMLNDLANEADTTILLLSQRNKQGGERGSEGIGNWADLMMTIRDNKQDQHRFTIWGGYNRLGEVFGFAAHIDKATSRMGELDRIHEEPKDEFTPTRRDKWWAES